MHDWTAFLNPQQGFCSCTAHPGHGLLCIAVLEASCAALQLQGLPLHDTVERLDTFWARVGQAWEAVQAACQSSAEQHQGSGGIGHSVVVVTHGSVISAMLCHALGLDQEGLSRWRMDSGGVTVIDFPDVQDPERVVVRTLMQLHAMHGPNWQATRNPVSVACRESI